MEDNNSMEVFAKAPIRKAVLQNALPAMAAMLMVLIYNLADTFSDKAIVLFHVPNAVQLGDVIQEEIDDGRFRGALRRSGNRCAEEE